MENNPRTKASGSKLSEKIVSAPKTGIEDARPLSGDSSKVQSKAPGRPHKEDSKRVRKPESSGIHVPEKKRKINPPKKHAVPSPKLPKGSLPDTSCTARQDAGLEQEQKVCAVSPATLDGTNGLTNEPLGSVQSSGEQSPKASPGRAPKGAKKGTKSKGRPGKKEREVSKAAVAEIQQLQGTIDAMLENQPEPVIPYHSFHPILDQILRPLYDSGQRFKEVFGTGPWFNLWNSGVGLTQFKSADHEDALTISASPVDPWGREATSWLGPTFYQRPPAFERSEEFLGLWDQRLIFISRNVLRFWRPVLSFDDVTYYERYGNESEFVAPVRWEIQTIKEDQRDFYGKLVGFVAEPLWGLIDTWAIRSYQSKNNSFTVESLRTQIYSQNKMFLWSGSIYCPPELMMGMVAVAQDLTHKAYTSSMITGQYWRTAPMNFVQSMPSRLVSLGVSLYGFARSATDSVAQIVADQVETLKDAIIDEDEKTDDELDFDVFSGRSEAVVESEEAHDPRVDLVAREASSHETVQQYVSSLLSGVTRGFSVGIGLPPVDAPPLGNVETDLHWEDPLVFGTELAKAKIPLTGADTAHVYGFFSFTRSNFVPLTSDELIPIEQYKRFPTFKEPRKLLEWKTTRPLERREPTGRFYGIWEFGWPLYSPQQSSLMTFCTCLIRLGPEPKYVPLGWDKKLKPWCRGFYEFATLQHLMRFIRFCFVRPDGILVAQNEDCDAPSIPEDRGNAWALTVSHHIEKDFESLSPHVLRAMTANMKNARVRVADLVSHMGIEMDPLSSEIDCFTKTDELLTSCKPRLIHNVPSSKFWAMRDSLQGFSELLSVVWFLTFEDHRNKFRVTLTYGGAMNPDEKGAWRNELPRHMSRARDNYHILVGGDDILIICSANGEEWEIELDVSRCDQSQSGSSYRVFIFLHEIICCRPNYELYKQVRNNMKASTTYYKQYGYALETGMGETTLFNSCTIGGVALMAVFCGCTKDDSAREFYNMMGYDVKVSSVRLGAGTFHKGFWALEDSLWTWMPLPSRIVKFGWKEYGCEETVDLENHLCGVARGWRSMDLDPIFGAFIEKFPPVERGVAPTEFGLARAWKKWDWSAVRPSRRNPSSSILKFYYDRYAINSEEAIELLGWIEHNVSLEPAVVRHPLLQRIYVRDYGCDTDDEFRAWLSSVV